MADYLELGSQLEDFCKSLLPDVPVRQLSDWQEIQKLEFRGRLICIAYAGENVGQSQGRSQVADVTHVWLTIVSVQTAGKALSATDRVKAGPILSELSGLQGAEFDGFYPLTRITPPKPRYEEGFAHYTLAWLARQVVQPKR